MSDDELPDIPYTEEPKRKVTQHEVENTEFDQPAKRTNR